MPNRAIHYSDLIATDIESDKDHKAFIAPVIIDEASVTDDKLASSPEREETQDAKNIYFNTAALSERVDREEDSEAEIFWIMHENSLDTKMDTKAPETREDASTDLGAITKVPPN